MLHPAYNQRKEGCQLLLRDQEGSKHRDLQQATELLQRFSPLALGHSCHFILTLTSTSAPVCTLAVEVRMKEQLFVLAWAEGRKELHMLCGRVFCSKAAGPESVK